MAKAYTGDTVEEIKSRCDLVEIVNEKIYLEKKGKNYLGLCPFHLEKTPSFSVSPEKQLYHCFGCGASGDLFSYVMHTEKMTFKEALRFLAKRAGVSLAEEEGTNNSGLTQLKETYYKLNEQAMNFFHYILRERPEGEKARRYLESRGIKESTLQAFKIGFAPPSWDALLKAARKKGYGDDELAQAGLVVERNDGSGYYDRFRNRIIFPIFDYRKRVIGFGGRVIDEETKGPKYLNSPETLLFDKRKVLYGIDRAITDIRQQKRAIVMEGYTDVILAHQENITNAVASLGTALTSFQARALRAQAEEVVIAYDADAAGAMAAEKGLDILKGSGCIVKVATFPEGLDPDSYIRHHGKEAFVEVLQNAQPLVDYRLNNIKRKHDLERPEGKILFIKEVLPVLDSINNMVEKDEYLKRLAEELNISEEALRAELKKFKRKQNKAPAQNMQGQSDDTSGGVIRAEEIEPAEKIILSLLFAYEGVFNRIVETVKDLNNKDFFSPNVGKIINACKELKEKGKELKVDHLRGEFPDESLHELIAAIDFNNPWEGSSRDEIMQAVDDCMRKLKINKLAKDRQNIEKKIKEAERNGMNEQSLKLLAEWEKIKLAEQELCSVGKKEV